MKYLFIFFALSASIFFGCSKQQTCPISCASDIEFCTIGFSRAELNSCIVILYDSGKVIHYPFDSLWHPPFYYDSTSDSICTTAFILGEQDYSGLDSISVTLPRAGRNFQISGFKTSGTFNGSVDCYEGGQYTGQSNCNGPYLNSYIINGSTVNLSSSAQSSIATYIVLQK